MSQGSVSGAGNGGQHQGHLCGAEQLASAGDRVCSLVISGRPGRAGMGMFGREAR